MFSAMTDQDARALLQLFDAELAGIKFPDVDRDVLTRALAALADADAEVAAADTRAQTARAAAADRRHELRELCRRALAYARVYAEGSAELSQRLDALAAPPRAAAPKKRGRPRKAAAEQVAIDAAE